GSGDPNRVQLAELRDVNGDGLPDYLNANAGGVIKVSWGTGGDYGSLVTMQSAPYSLGVGKQASDGSYRKLDDHVDMNGEGVPDFVSTASLPQGQITVRYNFGGVWDTTAQTYTLSSATFGSYQTP